MMQCHLIHFSPTYSTLKILQAIGRGTGLLVKEWDMSRQTLTPHQFSPDDLLIFGVPVFGGRVPISIEERIKNYTASLSPTAVVVVYGNREYDDALLELHTLAQEQGCAIFSAAAFVAQHSLCRDFAAGRPDDADLTLAEDYGRQLAQKAPVASGTQGSVNSSTLAIKGNRPYKERKPAAAHPIVAENCTECGTCAELCPMGAIPLNAVKTTNSAVCINCARCIAVCPEQARDFPAAFRAAIKSFLTPLCTTEKQPELFFRQ